MELVDIGFGLSQINKLMFNILTNVLEQLLWVNHRPEGDDHPCELFARPSGYFVHFIFVSLEDVVLQTLQIVILSLIPLILHKFCLLIEVADQRPPEVSQDLLVHDIASG